MKRLAAASLTAALLLSPLHANANAAGNSSADSIRFTVSSKTIQNGDTVTTLPVAPYIDQGHLMVPLRMLAAGLHADIRYDAKTKDVTITKDDRSIRIRHNDKYASESGKTIKLPVRPVVRHNSALGPVRAIASAFDAEVSWNSSSRSVTVSVKRDSPSHRPVRTQYTFKKDAEGWTGGFADLPVNYDSDIYELEHRFAAVPDQKKSVNGLLLQGMNRSDDLFMYVVKKIDKSTGLKANAKYNVRLSFDLATDQASGGIGIGGAPAESVFVKAGVVHFKPMPVKVNEAGEAYYRMNLDKGNQAVDGEDMIVLGNIAKPDADKPGYHLKPFEHEFTVQTNDAGEAYVIIGTDSGFEGLTAVYITNVVATFTTVTD